ncbi:MAG: ATP/GTP-binding protein [Bacteroidales bacterium]|nr:ATP/GTP-binding protein [Bacteroidales bacterium]MBN2820521.1 ATP/GTP-binding protein [Bacteroidales bacterium]
MPKTAVYLVTGFLGSGKTTFVKELINFFGEKKKLGIIQNEFAPANFDGIELKRHTNTHFDLLEVNNGSVFCVCLLSSFIPSLKKFVTSYEPDLVFMEASGLSDPVSVGEIFNSKEILNSGIYLAGIICIVDAVNYLKLENFQMRMVHQVQIANLVVINKADLVNDINEISKKIKEINPHAEIEATSYCNLNLEKYFNEEPNTYNPVTPVFCLSAEDMGRPQIFSSVFKTVKSLKELNFETFINHIKDKVFRLKGYVYLDSGRTISVQISGDILRLVETEQVVKQTLIIAMSNTLQAQDIKEFFMKLC